LAIEEAKLGKDHPDVAITLNYLADMYQLQDKYAEALVYARKASAAVIAHAQFEGAGAQQRGGAKGLVEQRAAFFRRHVLVLAAARRQGIETEAALTREGFEIAQWAGQSSAAAAVAQMAARQAKGTGPLAQAVRERQDLERQWRVADARLNDAVAKGDVTLASELRRELGGLDGKFAGIDARLVREFPDYAELSSPKPLSIAAAQALLGTDEALVFWLVGYKESYVFAVSREGFEWKTIALGAQALAQKVAGFRRGLDVEAVGNAILCRGRARYPPTTPQGREARPLRVTRISSSGGLRVQPMAQLGLQRLAIPLVSLQISLRHRVCLHPGVAARDLDRLYIDRGSAAVVLADHCTRQRSSDISESERRPALSCFGHAQRGPLARGISQHFRPPILASRCL
jgi:hypothetical protein